MNILSNVTIDGFWGSRKVSIQLYPDVNFLIGVNGSGKTTLINMVAAALNADFQALDRLPFDKITLHLAEVGGSKKPSIEVEKTGIKNSPFNSIKYRIKEKASGEAVTYSLDDLEEQLAIREGYPIRYYREIRRSNLNIIEHLRRIINVNWLSIHRSETSRILREDRSNESTVDRKLEELSNELIKYFSQLARRGASEANKFQKTVFLSLIPNQTERELFLAVKKLDIDNEKKALIEIFREFNVEETVFSNSLEKYFEILKKAVENLHTGGFSFNSEQLFTIVSAHRVHSVVQEWNKLVELQEKIYEPREIFLKTVNNMLQRKYLEINDKNELIAVTQSEKKLFLKELSSGEKQLLIILGAALLQEENPWIYIADEPELSLHVEWQGQLITNLRSINPKAQIIFATHSPDIVSVYGERVFDMEKLLA
ncbi:AAA family ATPase [Coleofasciculus sp. FACHB-SPT36]|uniref:AAA family ATPase n=1 Tax=Cyanophyceae TaxID=3028117 RepID=UPI00168B4AEF|nr:AAA family ATPase [Coleofasciculus sp. FACHB-SPT36]MBD2539631.1 AAA family ATPase [Coleofasciculus sp. FACHB-SPT36]